MTDEKYFTADELAAFNGQDGKPIYIAYKDRVIDVTGSGLWANGLHMMSHHAGKDLTDEFKDAPHGTDVFDRYPGVGKLKKEEIAAPEVRKIPKKLNMIFDRFPLLRHHPHPFLVHFPIVLFVAGPIFNALFLLTGIRSFETTSFHCLAGGLLFTLAAIPSGLLTWWLNYSAKFFKPIVIKIILSPILFLISLIVFIWRFNNPQLLERISGTDYLYLLLFFSMAPLVLVIGWFGATMTFPIHRD